MRSKVLTTASSGPAQPNGHAPTPPPRLLVLLCDSTIPQVYKDYGDYHDIFSDLFSKSLVLAGKEAQRDLELEIRSFDVREGEYPDDEELRTAKGVLLTGSASSAYADIPWIKTLISFTAGLPTAYPSLKLIGICFGHQIMGIAFGGACEKNPKGWELGVRTVELTDVGRKVFGSPETEEGKRSADGLTRIFQVHQDHVPSLPPGFQLLGSTAACAVQGMLRLSPSASPSSTALSDISILSLQGHPEFKPDVVLRLIDAREQKGIIGKELAEQSRVYAKEHDDGIWLGRVCLSIVLGV